MKDELDKLSEITVTDYEQPHYPDFNEDYDRELKESRKEVYETRKRIRLYDSILLATWALVIPCLLGLLVNDSLKGCAVEKTESITIGK